MRLDTEAILKTLKKQKALARLLRISSIEQRNAVLNLSAELLKKKTAVVLQANSEDLGALPKEATPAFRDRLLLNPERIAQAAESLKQVAALSDPINEEVSSRRLENGLLLRQVRAPLGVILMIFESRPNVALESFSLALKSGNSIILRGGKESVKTTAVIYEILREALSKSGLSSEMFWGITNPDRELVGFLLKQNTFIDVVVPRGGESLIQFVVENSNIPVIKNDRGLCHVYVDETADLQMATQIVKNAKTQRPGVCNAMETVLVHAKIKDQFIPQLYEAMQTFHVQWFGCPETVAILKGKTEVVPATQESWNTEYLDMKMNCRVVPSLDVAIDHIENFGSHHSESIVTKSKENARRFQSEIDAACVYWNASTRFTDGFEFGLGGELGISTQKLHARGPVGLKELTSARWIVDGDGQTRG